MNQFISGTFDDAASANKAVNDIVGLDYPSDRITIIMSSQTRYRFGIDPSPRTIRSERSSLTAAQQHDKARRVFRVRRLASLSPDQPPRSKLARRWSASCRTTRHAASWTAWRSSGAASLALSSSARRDPRSCCLVRVRRQRGPEANVIVRAGSRFAACLRSRRRCERPLCKIETSGGGRVTRESCFTVYEPS
jgi:hypothetical protein